MIKKILFIGVPLVILVCLVTFFAIDGSGILPVMIIYGEGRLPDREADRNIQGNRCAAIVTNFQTRIGGNCPLWPGIHPYGYNGRGIPANA